VSPRRPRSPSRMIRESRSEADRRRSARIEIAAFCFSALLEIRESGRGRNDADDNGRLIRRAASVLAETRGHKSVLVCTRTCVIRELNPRQRRCRHASRIKQSPRLRHNSAFLLRPVRPMTHRYKCTGATFSKSARQRDAIRFRLKLEQWALERRILLARYARGRNFKIYAPRQTLCTALHSRARARACATISSLAEETRPWKFTYPTLMTVRNR